MSKLFAITTTGKKSKPKLDKRFGNCENLVVFCPSSNEYSIFENPFKGEADNEVKLIHFLKELGITAIITGTVGPVVLQMLDTELINLIVMHNEKLKVFEIMNRIIP